ncbi:MAG: hypothetical protein UZ16_OP3001001991 [Candidatus Hinthialibacteria bacterium OLB16]|nr:MAG: hypothetical protein UZ16_OP3001001991 [Candidatus Hinthialibacteria bacterium OLB16]
MIPCAMRWNVPYPETEMNLLGVRIHRLTRTELLDCFEKALDQTGPLHFAYLNVAVSNQAADQPEIHQLLSSADLVYVDGAGIQLGVQNSGGMVSCTEHRRRFSPPGDGNLRPEKEDSRLPGRNPRRGCTPSRTNGGRLPRFTDNFLQGWI